MIDGKGFGDHLLIVILGIADDGRKRILGTAEGSTENGALCRTSRTPSGEREAVAQWMMAIQWAVTAAIEAEKKFRRIRGHKQMPQLIGALGRTLGTHSMDTEKAVA